MSDQLDDPNKPNTPDTPNAPSTPADKTPQKTSWAWWLLPLFFGIIGGAIGYWEVSDRDKKKAKRLFYVGLILSIPSILMLGMTFLLATPYAF